MSPPPSKLSTTRSLWMLTRYHHLKMDHFYCPSSQDQPINQSDKDADTQIYWDFGSGDIPGPASEEQARQGWSQISYGYAIPYGKHARPSPDWDKNIWVADKGPYGAAIEAGFPTPPPIPDPVPRSAKDWRPWNSPNHNYEGQVVLYGTSHAEFTKAPTYAYYWENIYTQNSNTTDITKHRENQRGNPPVLGGKLTPACDTDSFIYP